MSIPAVTGLLRERLGIDPDSLGAAAIDAAVAKRTRAIDIDNIALYATRVAADVEEFQALVEEVSVPETWFFRGGMDLFTHLAATIRDASRAFPPRDPFRVLSAPCSSGEEPYSLAIALAEAGVPAGAFAIAGLDISRSSLQKASTGRYRDFAFRQTDAALRDRYFRSVESGWEIAPVLRAQVHFRQGNLVERASLDGERPYDLIFCRNLLIYLHSGARVRVLDNLNRILATNGLLCMGHAEPIQFHDPRFELVTPERFMLFRRARVKQQPATEERHPLPRVKARAAAAPKPSLDLAPELSAEEDSLAGARRLADTGQVDAALAACAAHLDRAGPSAGAFALLGILRQARHEEDEAIRCFEKALYLEPHHDEALMHLMLLCQERGDASRAATLRRRLQQTRCGAET